MGKAYKLNKSELTKLKREEKVYLQFLPVLKLKQEQLQVEQIRIKKKCSILETYYSKLLTKAYLNTSVFPDESNPYTLESILKPKKISIVKKSVAGVCIPVLENVVFDNSLINFFDSPCWFLLIISELKSLAIKNVEIQVVKKQYKLISKELKKSTQKVNLFEKVLIPETKSAIKRINIVLGDEQVAAVGRGKIAKSKTACIL